jgi:hypothetical protein
MGEESKPGGYSLARLRFARVRWPAAGGPLAGLLAASLVLMGAVFKLLLEQLGGEALPPYITFYPAVVLAALAGHRNSLRHRHPCDRLAFLPVRAIDKPTSRHCLCVHLGISWMGCRKSAARLRRG